MNPVGEIRQGRAFSLQFKLIQLCMAGKGRIQTSPPPFRHSPPFLSRTLKV